MVMTYVKDLRRWDCLWNMQDSSYLGLSAMNIYSTDCGQTRLLSWISPLSSRPETFERTVPNVDPFPLGTGNRMLTWVLPPFSIEEEVVALEGVG